METDEIIANIVQWHKDRNLIAGSSTLKQLEKLEEEFDELKESLRLGTTPIDDLGDMIVVMINIATRLGLSLQACMEHAWDEIKDRKGKMIDGLFVKEEDLHKYEQ